MTCRHLFLLVGSILALAIACPTASADVGKGLLDPNVASEAELSALPHMTPALVKGLMDRRPFATVVELNAFLLEQKITQQQVNDVFAKAFIHVNLDTGTREEIMLIPGAGARMAREFAEYRPWKTWAQFDREIGKYVGPEATAKLAQYAFIPMNANTAPDADLMTVPGATQAWVDKVKKGRPYKAAADLEKTAGKAQARFFVVD
jgi:DNA uptake protein ComE-like DNA-binding protein